MGNQTVFVLCVMLRLSRGARLNHFRRTFSSDATPRAIKFVSAASRRDSLDAGVAECFERLGDASVDADVLFVFTSEHDPGRLYAAMERVCPAVNVENVFGCSSQGVIGGQTELWGRPGVSITAAKLPGVQRFTFQTDESCSLPASLFSNKELDLEDALLNRNPHFVILGSRTFDMESFLAPLDASFPGGAKVGGVAGDRVLHDKKPAMQRKAYTEVFLCLARQGAGSRPYTPTVRCTTKVALASRCRVSGWTR